MIALAHTPWIYLALFVVATIDGFFPPIPSESALIALAALWGATGSPALVGLLVAGAAGAIAGDHVAYLIGTRVPLQKLPGLGGARGRRVLASARAELEKRGASYLIAARFIPVGRVAVNLTAGHVGLRLGRFSPLIAIAGVFWACYSTIIGLTAGAALKERPLLAVVVGIVAGVTVGLVVDQVVRWVLGRAGNDERPSTSSPAD